MSSIDSLINPERLTTLKGTIPSEGVKIYVINDILRLPKTPVILKNIFPFTTIEDLKNQIWLHEDASPDFMPRYTFLGYFYPNEGEDVTPQRDQMYLGADYLYYDTGASISDPIILKSPLDVVGGSEVDERFVDSEGRLQALKIIKRERTTIEDVFLNPYDNEMPVFHLFTLFALKQLGNLSAPVSDYDFNGRLAPYFPSLSSESSLEASDAEAAFGARYAQSIRARNKLIENVERLLEEEVPGLATPELSGVTRMRLIWKKAPLQFPGCEGLFYDLLANEQRPFIRYLPVDGIPLTKLYSPEGSFSIPDTIPIDIIKQWAQEKAPISDSDYLFAKILIHQGGYPVYGSLRIQQDGTADFVLMPPKNVRKLSPTVELSDFETKLSSSLTRTGFENTEFSIGDCSIISFIRIDSERITGAKIQQRLKYFAPFFQQIASLPNQQTLISLRYKKVSNFAYEDRIFAFLTQVIASKQAAGNDDLSGLPQLVAEEFDISEAEAQQRVIAWRKSREQFSVADAKKNDVKFQANPGTDIYVMAQHPFYFFHIQRADNGEQLARIHTLLSMLFTAPDDEFHAAAIREASAVPESVATVISPAGDITTTAPPAIMATASSPEVQLSGSAEEDDGEGFNYDFYEIPGEEQPEDEDVEPAELPPATAPPTAEDLQEAKKVVATVAQPPLKTPAAAAAEPTRPIQEGKIIADSFYIKRLKDLDKELFVYKKAKGDKSLANYSVGCAANEDRQPLVMDELQYKRMRDIYDEDDDLIFIEYPLKEKKTPNTKGKEIIYVLKYGSDPSNQNYFICAEYFCIRDDMILRKHEFEFGMKDESGAFKKIGGKYSDREGGTKAPNECPFCHGKVIKNKDAPESGETVLKRKNKPKKDIPHLFIRFLTKKKNPDGLSLPCCFIDPVVIRYEDSDFAHIREYEQKFKKTDETADPATPQPITFAPPEEVPNYDILKNHLNAEYIVGPEKYPMEAGKIGLCPNPLDKYLGQVSQSLVARTAIRQELKANAEGFLRVGVQNSIRHRASSLFAAIAPLLGNVDSPEEVADFIRKSVSPLIFQSLNFGNLVLEFFNPSDPSPTQNDLELWARKELRIDKLAKKDINLAEKKDYIERLYNAYNNFVKFVMDSSKPKELRQFAHMLAEPGVLTERGITIITIDYSGNPNLPDTEVTVRCPLQGYSSQLYDKTDIAFLTHDVSGIWEPIIYTKNIPAVGGSVERHEGFYTIQKAMIPRMAEEIQTRVREFKEKCNSNGLGAYTSQIGVKPETLIPKYTLLYANENERVPNGLVRDAYNHLVAATFVTDSRRLIAVPVADDGSLDNFLDRKQLAPEERRTEVKRIFFGWEDIQPAADTDEIIRFYQNIIRVKFQIYSGYVVKSIVRFRKLGKVAVKLANNILIPSSGIPEKSKYNVPVEDSDSFPEWYIDNQIVLPVNPTSESAFISDIFLPKRKKEIEEVFQHLRLTFTNYLKTARGGPELRKKIRKIIEGRRLEVSEGRPSRLELWERRKRLQILLEPLLRSWLNPQDPFDPRETLLRIDCRKIEDKGQCSNYCSWKEGSGCLIHTPTKVEVGSDHDVNDAPRFFVLRLLEELLRLPEKRRQLLEHDVSYLSAPTATTRMGNQLIIPEINAQWYQLLIEEMLPKALEKPLHYEEFSRISPPPTEGGPEPEPLPSSLIEMLGREEAKDFQLWKADNLFTLVVPLNIRLLDFIEAGENVAKFSQVLLDKVVQKIKTTAIQIDLTAGTDASQPFIGSNPDKLTDNVVIFVITESGEPAFLVSALAPTRPTVLRSTLGPVLQEKIKDVKVRLRIVRPKVKTVAPAPTTAAPTTIPL
jgi:hypothetical protein